MKKIVVFILFVTSMLSVNATTHWMDSLEEAQKLSRLLNKPILLDFSATWCGPCKAMDRDVWSNDEIKVLMNNFIPVKLDLDSNSSMARKYSVRGIPNILILDSWGNKLYQSIGYKQKGAVKKLLTSFSINFLQINAAMNIWEKSKKNSSSNLRVAQKYQEIAFLLQGEAKRSFLTQSNRYLKKASKYVKKDQVKEQKIELLEYLNKAYYGRTNAVLKKIHKQKDEILKSNTALYHYIDFYCNYKKGNEQEFTTALKALQKDSNANAYLQKVAYLQEHKE